jgi:hypothetical protein
MNSGINLGEPASGGHSWPVSGGGAAVVAIAAAPSLAAADRSSRNAALTLGLAQPGDTVLYLLLPLHAAEFGVSLPEAGLLLAANRLVRIAGYGWVARGYERFGPRAACVAGAIGAIGATFGYAVLSGVVPLLLARLLWGLSFAALNIATQALVTAELQRSAQRSGRARAIIAAGPMLGLIGGAVLAEMTGPRPVFFGLGIIALLAVPMALTLPGGPGQRLRSDRNRFGVPSPLDVWSFIQGLSLDGVFVIGLAVLAASALPQGAALAAGLALAMRYLAEIALGPPGGAIAARWGAVRTLILLSLGSAAGLAAISAGALWPGVIAIVLLRGMLQPLPAPVLAAAAPGPERIPAIARMATWRDLGAGVGPLVAGIILPLAPLALYAGAALILAAATVPLGLLQVNAWRRTGR